MAAPSEVRAWGGCSRGFGEAVPRGRSGSPETEPGLRFLSAMHRDLALGGRRGYPEITIPVMKTHGRTVISEALKNQWGCLRELRHNYHLILAALSSTRSCLPSTSPRFLALGAILWYDIWYYLVAGRRYRDLILGHPFYGAQWRQPGNHH
jgi:hypothetical protein